MSKRCACAIAGIGALALLGIQACKTADRASPYPHARHAPNGPHAWGVVFHDADGNGVRNRDESGIAGVPVSNGRDVVLTDSQGRYALPIDDDTIIFVVKPRGWMTPVSEHRLPRFHYIHKPDGSPPLKYPGVAPTGPLPDSVDFPLYRRPEPDRFRMVLFGDPQPYTEQEVYFLAHDVIEELIGVDAAFGVSLGDLVGDDLALFDVLNEAVALIGIDWYNVIGNHDINFDAADDRHADETYERVYGPPCYAFNYGPVHFIVIDDVQWNGSGYDAKDEYEGRIGPEQLTFISNDLAHVPRDQLVVLIMHIPLISVDDRDALFEILRDRPHTLSLAAHHHLQEHQFYDADTGWHGHGEHHHLINVTTSGSWWRGQRDEYNIPHALMRDGAPNGYSIVTFDGHRYSVAFKAARMPATYQMSIYAPDDVPADQTGDTEVIVNVFAGSQRSTVEMNLDHGDQWTPLQHVHREDVYFRLLKRQEEQRGETERPLPPPRASTHIWVGHLPDSLSPGFHVIRIRTTDMFNQSYSSRRVIRVR